MSNKQTGTEYLNLGEIFSALVRHVAAIILIALVSGIAGFCYSAFLATPLYSASAMMIVNSGEKSADYVSTDQLNSAASLVETYSIIITSDTVMDEVYSNLDMLDSYKNTVRGVSVSAVNETQIMKVTVTATDPDIALDVCAEITDVAPDVIVEAVEAGSCKVVQKASTTYKQVSPNVKRNTVLAFVLGFILASAFIVVLAILDNKVTGENDIKQLDLPLIGVIPSYEKGEK